MFQRYFASVFRMSSCSCSSSHFKRVSHGNIDVNDHDDRYILPINTFKDKMGSARKTDDQVRKKSSCSRMRSRSSSVFDIAEGSLEASTNTLNLADINNAQAELNNELTPKSLTRNNGKSA